jgi:hypothetical protein
MSYFLRTTPSPLSQLKGKQIELETMGRQFLFVGVILGDACFTLYASLSSFLLASSACSEPNLFHRQTSFPSFNHTSSIIFISTMFRLSTIVSSTLLVLAASQSALATPSPQPVTLALGPALHFSGETRELGGAVGSRSKTDGEPEIVPKCATTCNALQDLIFNTTRANLKNICNDNVIGMFETCFDCEVGAGAATAESMQPQVNDFVAGCNRTGSPVRNFTVVGKNSGAIAGVRVHFGVASSVVVGLAMASFALL